MLKCLLRIEDLKLFRDVGLERSVSRAAELNGVTQSAASQQLKELERWFRISLLDRTRRPIELTPQGRLVLTFCETVLNEKEELDRSLDKFLSTVEGSVRFATIYSVGLSEVSGIREKFSQRHPEVQLLIEYLRPERVYDAVLNDTADLGVVSYPKAMREIEATPWRQEEMVVAASPQHPFAQLEAVHVPQLEGEAFIGFDPDLPVQRHIDRFLRQQRVGVNRVMHFDNLDSIREAVAQGSGISIVPRNVLRPYVEQGRLSAIRIMPKGLHRPLGIIYRKRKKLTRAAQAFLDLLRESALPRTIRS